MNLALYDLLVITGALFLGGLVKGVSGMGMPLVAIPIIAGFLGVEHAVVVMTIPGILLNLWQVFKERSSAGGVPELTRLLVFGAFGALLGGWLLFIANENLLALALAGWILAYLAIRFLHPNFGLSYRTRMVVSPPIGWLAGVFHGATGISAPVLATYLSAIRVNPGDFVFAISALFLALAIAQYITFVYLGMYTPQLHLQGALAMIPGGLALAIGSYLRRWVDRSTFDRIIVALLVIVAGKLIWNVIG